MRLLSCIAFLALTIPALAYADESKWQGHIEVEGKWGTERSLGELGLFLPAWQNENTMVFGNVIGRLDDQNSSEGNFGLGLRHQINKDWIVGSYAFYDRRRTENDNLFHQATFGAEALSENLEFRINGYLPENDEKNVAGAGGGTSTSASISGGNFQLVTTTGGGMVERALPGADIEAGYKFKIPGNWEFWAYAGGFHFDADGYDNVSGPRGRVELSYNDVPYLGDKSKLTVGFETQTDNVRGGQSWGIARLRIPLQTFSGKKDNARPALSELDKRMTTRVVRDIDIVSAKGSAAPATTTAENATVTINNRTYSSVAEVSAATANVPAAVTAAGANSLVLFNGAGGTINTTDNINMLNGQALIGGGTVLTATGASGATASLTMPGTRPTINSIDGDVGAMAVRLIFNAAVIGIDITGTGVTDIGIGTSFASTNSLIENVSVQGVGTGITISNSFGVRVQNVEIANVTSGLNLVPNSGVTVEGLTVNNATGTGVSLQGASQLTLNNALITNVQNGFVAGVIGAKTLTMSNVEIGAVSGNGITLQNTNVTAAGTGNRITGPVTGNACVNSGGNSGVSIAFDDIEGGGPGTCP